MVDQNTGERKASFGCMDRMQEMMRMMMSEKKGPCCTGMGKMARMMESCCRGWRQEEEPADETDRKEPA